MKYLYIILSFILLTGCASHKELKMGYDAQIAAVQLQASRGQEPTLSIKCGDSSDACKGLSISYIDPRDRNNVVIPKVTNSNDALIAFGGKTVDSIVTIGKWGLGVYGVTKVTENLSNGGTQINTTVNGDGNTNSTAIGQNTISNESLENNSMNDSNNSSDSSNNSDNSNNSMNDSNNSSDSSNNSDNSNNSMNDSNNDNSDNSAVSAPTVVDPVVVDPVVVQP